MEEDLNNQMERLAQIENADDSISAEAKEELKRSEEVRRSWQFPNISDPSTNNFGSPTKPTVVILGTVGHGKSNFLNRLAGKNVFESKKQITSVTLAPKMIETEDFKLIDTPGLND